MPLRSRLLYKLHEDIQRKKQKRKNMQKILVTGGTGALGRHLVPQLLNVGYQVRVLSRTYHKTMRGAEYLSGDLEKGEGIEAALNGVDIVVHCAGSAKGDEVKASNLLRAASEFPVRHLVYISVVGADRVPVKSGIDRTVFGYFASKRAAEQLVMDSGIPWTILRATQFHDLTLLLAQTMLKTPVMPVFAGFRYRPVDSSEVAARLVELVGGAPAGLVPELGGPRIYTMSELMRSYLHATGKRRVILPIWLPGQAARAHRAGANLSPEHAAGKRTWEEFLAGQISQPQSDIQGENS